MVGGQGFRVETTEGAGERDVASTLIVENIQPLDSGVYTCIASNEVDTDMAAANLTVHSECQGYSGTSE